MKAILVIDVDDCINVESCKADVYVRFPFQSNRWVREYKNVSLKPMSQKREPKEEWFNEYHRDEFADGWNACIEKIVGETE